MLTLQKLKDMEPGEVIAKGETINSPEGVNMTNDGTSLRWIACRGDYHDWAIYIHHAWQDWEWIKAHGDKVCGVDHIKKLVPCDDEAYAMYRR